MPTLHFPQIAHQSFSEIPKFDRYRLMILIPFLDNPYAKLLALRIIIKSKKHYMMIQRMKNSAEVIVDIFEKELTWLTDRPKDFSFPEFSFEGYTFTLPDARFSQMEIQSLIELDSSFTRYLRTEKRSYLDAFLNELYIVKQTGKKPLKEVISNIPYPFQLDAFRMYAMIREKIFTSFPHLFPSPQPSKKSGSKPVDLKSIQDTTEMWHSVLFSLSETPAYPGMHVAKKSNMWEVLTYLDEKAYQIKKAKENKDDSV